MLVFVRLIHAKAIVERQLKHTAWKYITSHFMWQCKLYQTDQATTNHLTQWAILTNEPCNLLSLFAKIYIYFCHCTITCNQRKPQYRQLRKSSKSSTAQLVVNNIINLLQSDQSCSVECSIDCTVIWSINHHRAIIGHHYYFIVIHMTIVFSSSLFCSAIYKYLRFKYDLGQIVWVLIIEFT